jgi:hypothetical protein
MRIAEVDLKIKIFLKLLVGAQIQEMPKSILIQVTDIV